MFVTIHGKRIYYETFGRATQSIVFVHGWGGSHKSLKKLAMKASRKWRTFVFDLPGFGQSDNPDVDWGVKEYAELVVALMHELGFEKPVYFGHSFGGSVGVYIAANDLIKLSHLVLCAASFKRTGKKSRMASSVSGLTKTYFPFIQDRIRAVKLLMYKIFFRNSDLAKYPHLESNFRKIVMEDLSDLLEKITLPVLILWGARDTYTPVADADELAVKISGSQKVIFPHKSHNLPIRYPDDVWKEIRMFLG